MRFNPGLDALFLLLQEAEIMVGLEEIARLKTVFATSPHLDEDELGRVLEAILVKSVEQRAAFRRLYGKWLDTARTYIEGIETRAEVKRDWPPPSPPPPPRSVPDRPIDVLPTDQPEPLRTSYFRQKLTTGVVGLVVIAGAAVLLAVLFAMAQYSHETADNGPVVLRADAGPQTRDAGSFVAEDASITASFYRPNIEFVPHQPPAFNYLAAGLVLLSMLVGMGLWLRFAYGRWLPSDSSTRRLPRAALLVAPGPLPGRGLGEALLLDEDDEENLVWGAGRFVSEHAGRDLDIARSVNETAAAFGRPVLHYEAAHYQREIWLWVDQSLESPAARHLATELARLLGRAGVPASKAEFWGIPDQLRSETGDALIVDELDARRDSVAVVILTDGRLMAIAHRARDRRAQLHRLLAELSRWPRVTFIDFGRDPGLLGALVAPFGLRVIQPQDSAAAVGDVAAGAAPPEYNELAGDARVWAAACALSPRPVDDRTALSLRRILGLDVSPWVLETLRASAAKKAGGLHWTKEHRATLLDWLVSAEQLPADVGKRRWPGRWLRPVTVKLPPGGLLVRIVTAWDRLLDEREQTLRKQIKDKIAGPGKRARAVSSGAASSWENSRQAQEIALERAFIHLWDMPNRSTEALYQLYRKGHLRRTIRHYLGHMAPGECADHAEQHKGIMVLPWRLSYLRQATQVRLIEMGFGSQAKIVDATSSVHPSMPRPGRLYLAIGLCIGLAAGAVAALLQTYVFDDKPSPQIDHVEAETRAARGSITMNCSGVPKTQCRVTASAPVLAQKPGDSAVLRSREGRDVFSMENALEDDVVGMAVQEIAAGQTARVTWSEDLVTPCQGQIATPYGSVELLRCNSRNTRVEGEDGRWSFAVIYGGDGTANSDRRYRDMARSVAFELLDSGSVDGVYLFSSMEALPWVPLSRLARPKEGYFPLEDTNDQLLVVVPGAPDNQRRLAANLAEYTGNAVVLSADKLGRLSGITDDFSGSTALQAQLDDPLADILSGDASQFQIQGQGSCGTEGERCCNEQLDGDKCRQAHLECQDLICVKRATVCQSDERQCGDDNFVQICNATRTGWDDLQDCGNNVCVAGQCLPRRCNPGQRGCVQGGRATAICNRDGTGWIEQTICQNAICVDGQCRTRQCEPGARRCQYGNTYSICDPTGTSWQEPRSCGRDQVCVGGTCQRRTCTPQEQKCSDDGTVLITCNRTGNRRSRVPCSGDRLCRDWGCRRIEAARIDFESLQIELVRTGSAQLEQPARSGVPGQTTAKEKGIVNRSISGFTLECTVNRSRPIVWKRFLLGRAGTKRSITVPFEPSYRTLTIEYRLMRNGAVVKSGSSQRHLWNLDAEKRRHSMPIDIRLPRNPSPVRTIRITLEYSIAIELEEEDLLMK